MLILDAAAVRAAFRYDAAIPVMRAAMETAGRGDVCQPQRLLLDPPMVPGVAGLMAAAVGSGPVAFGFKAATLFPDNAARGLDSVQSLVALLDAETGVPRTLLAGHVVTEIRTAAVSAVATAALARRDACDLAVLGAGVQGKAHIEAISLVRTLRRIRVWNRTPARAEALVAWARQRGLPAEVTATARDAVIDADIICTTTASPTPVVDGDWLAPGVHINAVGAFQPTTRELGGDVVAGATVLVDSRESALAAAGDLLLAVKDGLLDEPPIAAELGDVLLGRHQGRTTDDQRTIFESLGLALQDVAAAAYIDRVARETQLGIDVPFP